MTEKEKKQFEEAYSEIIAFDKEQIEIRNKALTYVETQVSRQFFIDLIEYLKHETDYTNKFEITEVDPNEADKQSENYKELTELWVDQYEDGGISGDSFAGFIHVKINETEFLKFHYSM